MSNELVLTLAERGIFTILLVAGPILLLALAVGLLVSIFQATTQIQEQTLAFIPKIIAVLVGIVFLVLGCYQNLLNLQLIYIRILICL